MLEIKQEKFEGPLGLLLQLIEQEELNITEICLAKIADQYIERIKKINNIHPEEMTDFLIVAAKLLLIKSRALLPYLYPEEEKETKELEDQLKMYKEFVEASKIIENLIGKKKFMFARSWNRQNILQSSNFFSPPMNLVKEDLEMVFKDLILKLKPVEKLEEEFLERKIHIEEKIVDIQKMLINRLNFNFNNLIKSAESKTEIIVSFLAILELMKQKEIFITQEGLFKEIIICKI